jgi:hypothetical protein
MATVQLGLAADATADGDVLGVWGAPAAVPAGPSLLPSAASPVQDLPGLLFQARLPDDLAAAATVLRGAESRLAGVEPALSVAAQRLAAFPVTLPPQVGELADAEAKLTAYLRSDAAQAALAEFQGFVQQMQQVLTPQASIETTVGAQVVARSVLTVSSDLRTAWLGPVDAERAALHKRTVALALATRAALLRTVALTIRGAAILATGAAAGPLALPAAWRFIQDVRTELTQP